MGFMRLPVDMDLRATRLGRHLEHQDADRRAFLKAAAGLGLAVPGFMAAAGQAVAQDESTPEGAYTGGHDAEHGTGDSTPVPSMPIEHVVYDPFLPSVEPGPKEFTIAAVDATVFVAKDTPYAGWTWLLGGL